jgi:hypothetical protein
MPHSAPVDTATYPPSNSGFEQVSGLETPALIHRYRRGLECFDPRLFELNDSQMDLAFLPDVGVGNWPVRVLVGHLADAELVTTHRMRRAVAETNPLLSAWDEQAFVDSGMYGGGRHPVAGFVAAIHTLRRFTTEWLMSLSPEQLQRQALHPERGPESVRHMLALTVWHLEHHARFLNKKINHLLGVEPQRQERPAVKADGGCGPGCGCRR